jgi:hypothetical protein
MAEKLFENKTDKWFYDRGWLVLSPGEAYEYRLYERVSVYAWREKGKWVVYRASHHPGGKIKYEKTLKEFSPSDGKGFAKYVAWYIKSQENQKSKFLKGKELVINKYRAE